MKRGRPKSGGSSRNSDYYVKKFRSERKGERSLENYFKSSSSNSNTSTEITTLHCDENNESASIVSAYLYPNFMKLLSMSTVMPTSTASVERLFSRLNLVCTDLRTSLKQESLDRQLRIIVNGPKRLSDQQCENIVNIFKTSGNHRLLL